VRARGRDVWPRRLFTTCVRAQKSMADPTARDTAVQCLDRAKAAMSVGDWDKAVRMLEKSMRFCELPGAAALLKVCRSKQAPEPSAIPRSRSEGEGLRHRHARPTTPSAASESAGASYTPEQAELALKIVRAKDLFEVLECPRTASSAEVKKSFRKLALKMHPDKNSAPHAKEAFQKLNHAFSVLHDAEARQRYEMTGDDGSGAAAVPEEPEFRPRGGRYRRQEAHMDPDEFLRHMMFGGGAGGPFTFHFQVPRRGRRQYEAEHEEEDASELPMLVRFLQLAPLLLMLLFALASLWPSFSQGPQFSFRPEAGRSKQVHTDSPGVVPKQEYWVSPDVWRSLSSSPRDRLHLEQQVQQVRLDNLRNSCAMEERDLQRLRWEHQYSFGQQRKVLADKIRTFRSSNCDAYREFFARVQEARTSRYSQW
jgi:curved DNA-binding protein CbpA